MKPHPWLARVAIWAIVVAILEPVPAASGATPQQVQQAIEKAQKYLLSHRHENGTWEEVDKPEVGTDINLRVSTSARQWGGLTALSTYALLASGKDWRDPELAWPVDFLLHANIHGTYALGLGSQLVMFLPTEKTRDLVRHNVGMIGNGLFMPPPGVAPIKWPPETGFYSYWTGGPEGSALTTFDARSGNFGTPQEPDWYDRSTSQYAVLGMWALEQAGGSVPRQYWDIVDTAWKRAQSDEGGWNYREGEMVSPAMTAAGIATLFITQDYTLKQDWSKLQGAKDPFIERGLAWMDAHIEEAIGSSYYTLYGIERIGAASGRRFFGSKDWYQMGAEFLIAHQKEDGSWEGDRGVLPDTCFGLLFLARGRAPVLINKLEYQADKKNGASPDDWNLRPRDVAHLTAWVGRQEESYFNWQVVNLEVPPEQMHDAPILYISGSRALDFGAHQKDVLRRYVEGGGMILGNADGGRAAFATTFMKLGHELFPRYSFREVAPSDLIWREQFTQWPTKPKLMELSNGVRKLMLLIPTADAGRAWQSQTERRREPLIELGANIFLYAADKRNVMTKGETYAIQPDPTVKATGTLSVGRLDIGSNPDPEPGGWQRLGAVMHNRFKTDLQTKLIKPAELTGYAIAHLTGTGGLTLTPQDRAALTRFVNSGGTLIVDTAGGNSPFAEGAQTELEALFGPGKLAIIPPNSPVYQQEGHAITTIGWRHSALDHVVDRKHPQLRGVTIGNRIAVFFSREDLSAGLVGENVDGINGYDPATATDLMVAVLTYAGKSGNGK